MQIGPGPRQLPPRHHYAGGNQILDNHVHNVMNVLNDGGPIYTNGGQGDGNASTTSILAGNLVGRQPHQQHALPGRGQLVLEHLQQRRPQRRRPLDRHVDPDHPRHRHPRQLRRPQQLPNNGTNITFNQATIVTNGAWPAAAQAIINTAGPAAPFTR